MAVVLAASHAGSYIRTFTVTADAADGAGAGLDSAATAHGLGTTPIDFKIVDTTAAGTLATGSWAIHTVGVAAFTVRKLIATNENRTALVILRNPHSIDR